MGLSRRQFTKQFKLATVQRLEQGISIAEVVRGIEFNPNVLHRWRREFREAPATCFRATGRNVGRKGGLLNWKVKIGQQALEIDSLSGCLQRIEE